MGRDRWDKPKRSRCRNKSYLFTKTMVCPRAKKCIKLGLSLWVSGLNPANDCLRTLCKSFNLFLPGLELSWEWLLVYFHFFFFFLLSGISNLSCFGDCMTPKCRTLPPSKCKGVDFTTEDGVTGFAVLLSMGEKVLEKWLSYGVRVRVVQIPQWDLPFATGFNWAQHWISHSDWAGRAQVEKGEQQGVRAGGISGPCQMPCLESEMEQNRGSLEVSWFFGCSLNLLCSVDSQQTSASASCKGLCFPWYCFSHSENPWLFLPQIFCFGMSSYTGIVS